MRIDKQYFFVCIDTTFDISPTVAHKSLVWGFRLLLLNLPDWKVKSPNRPTFAESSVDSNFEMLTVKLSFEFYRHALDRSEEL